MANTYFNIILVPALIALNAFFVAAEYSLLTLRKTKIDQYVRQKVLGFYVVRKALNNLYLIISATQLGSTVCNIILGWYGEPLIEKLLYPLIKQIPVQSTIFIDRSAAILITISLLAFVQMIFGEIIPKTLALQKSELISRLLILPLNLFTFLCAPVIFVINGISNLILKIIHQRPLLNQHTDYSQDEIRVILDESIKNRIIPHHQARLLSNIFALQNTSVTKLMIDRNKLVCFYHDETLADIKKKIADSKNSYSRYPVYFSKNLIVGFIHVSDILKFSENGNAHLKLNETHLIHEILYVSETFPVDSLLVNMREKGIHAAAIIDQGRELLGIITLTDIVQFLVNHR